MPHKLKLGSPFYNQISANTSKVKVTLKENSPKTVVASDMMKEKVYLRQKTNEHLKTEPQCEIVNYGSSFMLNLPHFFVNYWMND